MSSVVIEVTHLSKEYRLGTIGRKRLSDDLSRWWAKFRGGEDPLSKVGLPSVSSPSNTYQKEAFWALSDVSFQVREGEVLGIIGRNGAGKSTLLKILSRVTAPTSGSVRVRGRIASLLEVGTGFHPELTGRENIFLNGAILGMTKAEIMRKFDEIVAFAEIEKFLDTPVKRYSSGMYVRLAFAVAAHLDPEILIVDEVLAVGDAAFQKKCLGKMGEVARGGRTVLFVSHNLTVIATLCQRSLLLSGGTKSMDGATTEVLASYVSSAAGSPGEVRWDKLSRVANHSRLRLMAARVLCDGKVTGDVLIDKPTLVQYDFEVLEPGLNVCTSIHLFDKQGSWVLCGGTTSKILEPGVHQHTCIFPADFLNDGLYTVTIFLITEVTRLDVNVRDAISFVVHEMKGREEYFGTVGGCIRPRLEWQERILREAGNILTR
jgi:lipopolysaccharide transport system ATP-binding protein